MYNQPPAISTQVWGSDWASIQLMANWTASDETLRGEERWVWIPPPLERQMMGVIGDGIGRHDSRDAVRVAFDRRDSGKLGIVRPMNTHRNVNWY